MTAHLGSIATIAAANRLREIQDFVDRHALPDHDWAEVLAQTDAGSWTQAYMIRAGRASAITEVIWVPRSPA
jgi:hypothetical protein